jgi:hypothetical protein
VMHPLHTAIILASPAAIWDMSATTRSLRHEPKTTTNGGQIEEATLNPSGTGRIHQPLSSNR